MSIREHLESRGMNIHFYNGIHLDYENNLATFYIWNFLGKLIGCQKYDPMGDKISQDMVKKDRTAKPKYLTVKINSQSPFWGIESLAFNSDKLYIVEGVFDAVKLHNMGLSAIACLSNDPQHLKNQFRIMNRKIIPICDGDDAGRKLAKYGVDYRICPEGKDLGDLNYDEIKELLKCDI